jgi:hypothetical protein
MLTIRLNIEEISDDGGSTSSRAITNSVCPGPVLGALAHAVDVVQLGEVLAVMFHT